MPDTPFLSLPAGDRRDALAVAEREGTRRAHILEKDIWIVLVLHALFGAPFARELVFKGGTSLAKAYGAVRRFSEDVDITRDIRALAPDLAAGAGVDHCPRRAARNGAGRERSANGWRHGYGTALVPRSKSASHPRA